MKSRLEIIAELAVILKDIPHKIVDFKEFPEHSWNIAEVEINIVGDYYLLYNYEDHLYRPALYSRSNGNYNPILILGYKKLRDIKLDIVFVKKIIFGLAAPEHLFK